MRATGGLALALLLGKAMIGPLFSQSAWNNVTFTGGETRDPGRTLPRALVLGCGSVVLLYLLANVAYIVTLSLGEIQHAPQDRVGTAVMEAIFGPRGTVVMAVAIMVSTFGCVNGLVLAGARVYYAMARDGLFFRAIGTTNRRHVPAVALVVQGVWAALLTLPVTVTLDQTTGKPVFGNLYSELLEFIIPADLTFYALMVGAVILLRRKQPNLERPYRTFGYPIPALIYIGLAVLLVLDFVFLAPETSGIGYLIVLAGIPVYLVWSRTAGLSRSAKHAIPLSEPIMTEKVRADRVGPGPGGDHFPAGPVPRPGRADLDTFVRQADGAFSWTADSKKVTPQGTIHDLTLTSQVWKGITWKHRLDIYETNDIKHLDTVLLFITGGNNERQRKASDDALGFALARPAALLRGAPPGAQPTAPGRQDRG